MPYKDKIKRQEKQREYREKHKVELAIYQKNYSLKNKEVKKAQFIKFKSKNQEVFICNYCNSEFKRRIYDSRDTAKFCSSRCALNNVRTVEHQKKAGSKGALTVIERYRGTGTKGYINEFGRHQHRVVMEKLLGRKLEKGEIVHHKDGNKKNNDPSNLQVMTQAEHCRVHFTKKI